MLHVAQHRAPIEVLFDPEKPSGESLRVTALEDIAEKQLELPPCVPKASRLYKESSNPRKVEIGVVKMHNAVMAKADVGKPDAAESTAKSAPPKDKGKGAQAKAKAPGSTGPPSASTAALPETAVAVPKADCAVEAKEGTKTVYYAHPEWTMPEMDKTAKPPTWKWESDTTMHPVWAVRRLSEEQLKQRNAKEAAKANPKQGPAGSPKPGEVPASLSYNCSFVTKQFNVCNVGVFQSGSVALNLAVEVPLLTNFKKSQKARS